MSTGLAAKRPSAAKLVGDERVTVFVPTYNRARWLPHAIESALSQSVANFVLIVSDNCSTDETSDVVAAFDDPRLAYVRQERHLGLNEHFNWCYGRAGTEYMFLIPDDDMMRPDALERTMAVLDANPRVGLVHGSARLVAAGGTVIADAHHMTQLDGDEVESGDSFIRRAIDQGYRVHASTALIRTSALADVRLREDEFPVTDVGLWLRVALSWDIAFIAATLAVVRIHEGAYTADGRGVTEGGYVQHLDVIEKLREVKLRFLDENEDRFPDVEALRASARRASRRDLLDLGGHMTIPERRFLETTHVLGTLARRDPAILGEIRAWRLLGASILGRRAVERIKRQQGAEVGTSPPSEVRGRPLEHFPNESGGSR
jgi:glycosyltransferase involved in cell wall biosynthesis